MIRASFESDYNNGCLPEILRRLSETNDEKSSGYGFDPYTERAKDRIRKACDCLLYTSPSPRDRG